MHVEGQRIVCLGIYRRRQARPKENDYALELRKEYIVSGCRKLKRKFRFGGQSEENYQGGIQKGPD